MNKKRNILSICQEAKRRTDDLTVERVTGRPFQDSKKLQRWEQILNNDPDSEPLAAIHALWSGLCVKVEAKQLTTNQANRLFDRFRDALIEQINQQQPESRGKKS